MISFRRPLTPEERTAMLNDAREMEDSITQILQLKCGFDIGLNGTQSETFCLNAMFENVESYNTYQTHHIHTRFISNHIQPLLADRKAVQFETTA
jgi:hypothetical protein